MKLCFLKIFWGASRFAPWPPPGAPPLGPGVWTLLRVAPPDLGRAASRLQTELQKLAALAQSAGKISFLSDGGILCLEGKLPVYFQKCSILISTCSGLPAGPWKPLKPWKRPKIWKKLEKNLKNGKNLENSIIQKFRLRQALYCYTFLYW